MIKPTVVVALMLFGTSLVAEAQYDADVIDLLTPRDAADGTKRRCTVEIDKATILCNDAWYVQFNDGTKAIQFNQAIEAAPIVSLFGTEVAPNRLSIANVVVRLGNQSIPEIETKAAGECVLTKKTIQCQARTSDGRHIAGNIFPP